MTQVAESNSDLYKYLVIGETVYLGKTSKLAGKVKLQPPKIKKTS